MKSRYIKPGEEDYPEKLLAHLQDPQPIYARGDLSLANKKTVAVVGSRKSTIYGETVARSIGRRAAEYDVVVISGLARGIDSFAHRGTLEMGGKTIAVLGNGLDICYPGENRGLQRIIEEQGLIISEYPDDMKAQPYTFPQRNRLISAIADAVIIVEAEARSGALITAEAAMEQGKLLYAVPGNITSKTSFGTNKLIRDGASPFVSEDEVFLEMGCKAPMDSWQQRLGPDERALVDELMKGKELSVDQLIKATGMNAAKINGILTVLEMKGIAATEMGKAMLLKCSLA